MGDIEATREKGREQHVVCLGCRKRGHSLKNCPNVVEKSICFNCNSTGDAEFTTTVPSVNLSCILLSHSIQLLSQNMHCEIVRSHGIQVDICHMRSALSAIAKVILVKTAMKILMDFSTRKGCGMG